MTKPKHPTPGAYLCTCKVCKATFIAKAPHASFCSRECRNRARTKGYNQRLMGNKKYPCLKCGVYWPTLTKLRRICPECRELNRLAYHLSDWCGASL